jgi:hypothetical protein
MRKKMFIYPVEPLYALIGIVAWLWTLSHLRPGSTAGDLTVIGIQPVFFGLYPLFFFLQAGSRPSWVRGCCFLIVGEISIFKGASLAFGGAGEPMSTSDVEMAFWFGQFPLMLFGLFSFWIGRSLIPRNHGQHDT